MPRPQDDLPAPIAQPLAMIREFLRYEAAGGLTLIGAAVLGLVLANSPLFDFYGAIKALPIEIRAGDFAIAKPLIHWVNDGLMAIFFFLVGLEIKREFLAGELSNRDTALLPVLAAAGGMAVPALVYVWFNWDGGAALSGWAIPAATDIAFALGVMALLGPRVPDSLKVLLAALAVIDDLAAIVIIALFYTDTIALVSLGIAGVAAAGLATLNLRRVARIAPYVILGVIMWVAVLKSGVHATLAGVVTAMAIPLDARHDSGESPLEHLEHALHPWVAFAVLPLFGFLNAGVDLGNVEIASFLHPVTLGILGGLFVGKQLGVMGAIGLGHLTGLAPMPAGAGWLQLYGMAVLTGIGFTMSLFIAELAFGTGFDAEVRLGVLGASFLSALWGYLVLFWAAPRDKRPSAS